MSFSDKLILALDFPTKKEALDWTKRCLPFVKTFKVGLELFCHEGPSIVKDIQELGANVFLDLKLHDIPNTVASTCRALSSLNVFMLNVHTSGGIEMMRAACEATKQKASSKSLLIGVTVLTSLGRQELKKMGMNTSPKDLVLSHAKLAKGAGLDGIVCSVSEVKEVKKQLGNKFIVVTPGIRIEGKHVKKDDQKRVSTVEEALIHGSDYLVLGRSLWEANDPLKLLEKTIQRHEP